MRAFDSVRAKVVETKVGRLGLRIRELPTSINTASRFYANG